MLKSRACKISQSESLSAYADGMLDGQAMRRLTHHIDRCEDCREALDQQTKMVSLLRGARLSAPVPSPSFWTDAYRDARLAVDRPVSRPAVGAAVFAPRRKWRLAGLAAIGAATVALTLMPTGAMRGLLSQPADAAQAIDVSALVKAHASGTSDEPLVDRQRLSMIVSDIAAQQTGGDAIDDGSDVAEGAPYGGPVPE